MRAAIYARVSTEEQAQHGYSINEQVLTCTNRAKELGATEVYVFIDEGISGATLDRPDLNKLRDIVAQGEIDIFVARDPDRLSRRLSHQLLLTEELEKAEVQLEFLDFTWQDTPEGRLFYSMKGAISEYEREKIRERFVRGKNQKARQGGIPINFGLYGYDYSPESGVTINQNEAEIVQYIFNQFITYTSPNAITNELNEKAIPTKKNKGFWYRQVVRQIIMNPAYKGEWHYQKNKKEPIIIPVPAIINPNAWQKAQEILAESRRLWAKRGKQDYLLSGLITCTDCGTSMGGVYAKYWDRKVRCYTCHKSRSTNRIPGCHPIKRINAESLELIVWNEIKDILGNPEKLTARIKQRMPSDTKLEKELSKLEKQLRDTEKGRTHLLEVISSGLVDLDAETKEKLLRLKQRKDALERRIKEIKKEVKLTLLSKQEIKELQLLTREILKNIEDIDFEQKKRLVRSMISQIYVTGRTHGTYHKKDDLPGVDIKVVISLRMAESLRLLLDARY